MKKVEIWDGTKWITRNFNPKKHRADRRIKTRPTNTIRVKVKEKTNTWTGYRWKNPTEKN